jgi:RNA polymerase sigma-70 factor (ECF subfamily)
MADALEYNPKVSRAALAALHQAAFAWARSLTRQDAQAAADVLQQTYLVIVDGSARFDGRSSLKTFLFGVVRHMAARNYRGRRRRLSLVAQLTAETEHDGMAEPVEPQSGDPAMSRALRSLSHRQREVLELVFYGDFTIEEVATVLDISVGSARTHYHRAKQSLRKLLSGTNE